MSNKNKFNEIQKYINGEEGNNCILITSESEYEDAKTKLKIKCGVCGDTFLNRFRDFKDRKNKMCYKCHKDKMGEKYKTPFNIILEDLHKEGYEYIGGTYKNNKSKFQVKCPNNHITTICYGKFKYEEHRCTTCNGGINYTFEQVKSKIEKEKGYILLNDSYHNFLTPLRIKCNKGHVYDCYLSLWDSGSRCPVCKSSQGEQTIFNLLDKNNISFKRQYRIDGCIYKGELPFDFAVFNDIDRKQLKYLIEYDGEQHYIPINFGGLGITAEEKQLQADKSLKLNQTKDKIKDDFCKLHNIKLIRIPYWEFDNIDSILKLHKII